MCVCLKPFFVQYCTIQNDFGQCLNSCNPVIGIAFFCKIKVNNSEVWILNYQMHAFHTTR